MPMEMETPIPRFFIKDDSLSHLQRDALVQGYMKLEVGRESIPVEEEQCCNNDDEMLLQVVADEMCHGSGTNSATGETMPFDNEEEESFNK